MQEDKPEKEVARLTRELAVEKVKVEQRDKALAEAKAAIVMAREKMAELDAWKSAAMAELEEAVRGIRRLAAERNRLQRQVGELETTVVQANEKIRQVIGDLGK